MKKRILAAFSRLKVLSVFVCPILIATVFAQPILPEGGELYSIRPDIFTMKPVTHNNLNPDWDKLKQGHLEAVALLFENYKDHEMYFLARDSEYLYDLARLYAKDEPSVFSRLHLINISRTNMSDPSITQYLSQEGISIEALSKGKKVLFVDTGFSGTIPRIVSGYFPEALRKNLKTHLMCSASGLHPSSRVFLNSINSEAAKLQPGSLHGTIIGYEHLPRYTARSDSFVNVGDKIEPVSNSLAKNEDGIVSKDKARAYMEDLRAYAENPKNRAIFSTRRLEWRELKDIFDQFKLKKITKDKAIEKLKLFLSRSNEPIYEAMVRDFLDLSKVNFDLHGDIVLSDIGLAESGVITHSNKNELINKYPEWKDILEDPEKIIPKYLNEGKIGQIGSIVDILKDEEFHVILSQTLGEIPPTPETKSLVKLLINKNDPNIHFHLASSAFTQVNAKEMKDLIQLLIEKSTPNIHQRLIISFFSQHLTAEMGDLIQLLIEKGDPITHQLLADLVFSSPHTIKMENLIKQLIDKSNAQVKIHLAMNVFSKPHTKEMKKLIYALIEQGDHYVRNSLLQYTFSQPHTENMEDLIQLIIEKDKNNEDVLNGLITHVFFKPHSKNMKNAIRMMIQFKNPAIHTRLILSVFSQPHAAQMGDLIQMLIENATPELQKQLIDHVFSKPHAKGLKDQFWLLLEKMENPNFRADLLEKYRSVASSKEDFSLFAQASKLNNRKDRSAFIQNRANSIPSVDKKEFHETLKVDWSKIEIGAAYTTKNRRSLRIVKFVDEGKRGKVYEAVDTQTNARYALKVARDTNSETLESIRKESEKAALYQKYSLPHAGIIEQGDDYVLKEWIDGLRADVWVKSWEKSGYPKEAAPLIELQNLIKSSSKKGVYVGDLNPKNLIWNGSRWIIIDSGGISEGLTESDALEKYLSKLPNRFGRKVMSPNIVKKCLLDSIQTMTIK